MSNGNRNSVGDFKNNQSFQWNVLKLLGQIINNTGGGVGPGLARTPEFDRVTAPGTLTGKRSISIYNAGVANGTVLGKPFLPSEQFTWSADGSNTLNPLAYDATGTEFVIVSIV